MDWLEKQIEEAGREAVFERARTYGWNGEAPPWVWAEIAREVKDGRPPSVPPPQRLDEALLGFRLF